MQFMQENPQTYLDNEPLTHNQPTVSPGRPRKNLGLLLLVTGVTLLAIVTSIILVYISRHKNATSSGSSKQSLTFYYRDGKTVLWDSSKDHSGDTEASGFIARVKQDLGDTYSPIALEKGDWHVTTTLDAKLQQKAKEQVIAGQATFDEQSVKNGALIAEDVTNGQIVSWIGGLKDFDANSDTVSQKTVVGSLALPLTYALLIENTTNYGAGSVFTDEQVPLEGYPCTNKARPTQGGNCLYNYDYRYVGQLTLRQALGAVRLVPAAKAGQTVGTLKLVSYFNKLLPDSSDSHFACYMAGSADLSYKDETQCYLATAHGDGLFARPQDMIQAYATLANNGKSVRQISFLSVTVDGKSKQTLKPKITQAIRPDTAYIISDILSDPSNNYLPASYDRIFTSNGSKVSVQTGVTSDGTVGSMVQYTNKYAIGFWGLATGAGQSIKGASETITEPVVTGWLSAAQAGVTQSNRSKPANIKELASPAITLSLPTSPIGPSPEVDLYPSWYK
jgi:membrane peptidoglycan carboxypeptidase